MSYEKPVERKCTKCGLQACVTPDDILSHLVLTPKAGARKIWCWECLFKFLSQHIGTMEPL